MPRIQPGAAGRISQQIVERCSFICLRVLSLSLLNVCLFRVGALPMRSHGQGVGLLGHDEQGRRRCLREEVRQEEDLRQTQVREQVLHRRLSRL